VRIGLKFTTAGSSELCVTVIITLLTAAYSRTEFTEMFSLTSQLLLRRLETRHCSLDDRCCCCGAVAAGRRPCSNRSISPVRPSIDGTDRQTDTVLLHVKKAVIDRILRPRCCHRGSYFKRVKAVPCSVRWPATGITAQFVAKPKAACALHFSWAATSSNLGL